MSAFDTDAEDGEGAGGPPQPEAETGETQAPVAPVEEAPAEPEPEVWPPEGYVPVVTRHPDALAAEQVERAAREAEAPEE